MNTGSIPDCCCHDGKRKRYNNRRTAEKAAAGKRGASGTRIYGQQCSVCNYWYVPQPSMLALINKYCEQMDNDKLISSCRKHDGSLKDVYPNKRQAEGAARQIARTCGQHQQVYKCEQCGFWHHEPKFQTHCAPCNKPAFDTMANARKIALMAFNNSKVRLYVYECEYGNGFHLTRRSTQHR